MCICTHPTGSCASARRLSRFLPLSSPLPFRRLAHSFLPPRLSARIVTTNYNLSRANRGYVFTTCSHYTIAPTTTNDKTQPRTTPSPPRLPLTTPVVPSTPPTLATNTAVVLFNLLRFLLLPVHSSSRAPVANPRQEFPSTAKPGRANSARGAAASAPQTRRWREAGA